MSPALSSPRPAARISRANSTPPRPTNRLAVMRSWNSSRTPSTSSGSTEPSFISSRVSISTSRGHILASSAPASSLDSWAMKTAALRRPGSSLRSRTAGRMAVCAAAGAMPTICSTDARVIGTPRWRSVSRCPGVPRHCMTSRARSWTPPRWRSSELCPGVPCRLMTSRARSLHTALAQPAAQHGGHLVRLLTDHRGDLAPDPGPLGGLQLPGGVVDRRGPRALDADPVELGHHVVGELQSLVVLLLVVVLLAPRAQPDDEDEQGDAQGDAAGADQRPHLGLLLGLLGGLELGGRGVGGGRVEGHGGDGDVVPPGDVQAHGVADELLDLRLVEVAGDGVVHDDGDGEPVDPPGRALDGLRRRADGVVGGRGLLVVRGVPGAGAGVGLVLRAEDALDGGAVAGVLLGGRALRDGRGALLVGVRLRGGAALVEVYVGPDRHLGAAGTEDGVEDGLRVGGQPGLVVLLQ